MNDLPACVSVFHMHACIGIGRNQKRASDPLNGVTDDCQPLCAFWGLNRVFGRAASALDH